jgi:DNA recombination protein RmuC
MTDEMTMILTVASIIFTSVIVWLIMSQRMTRMIEKTRSESDMKIAEIAAREEERKGMIDERNTAMSNSFKLIAQQAFEDVKKNAEIEKKEEFKRVTDDFSTVLKEYKKSMDVIEASMINREAALREKVENVSQLGLKLSDDTQNLTKALKGDSQSQGAWGEVVVENLLQSMGFVSGRDYVKQYSETALDKTRKVADFVIYLPDNKQVVIDSKVSLTSYNEFVNADNELEANTSIEKLCKSIRAHASGLSSKNYQHMESIQTLDFVLMVVPLESAYIAALHHDPSLYNDMVGNRRVKIVSGTTIMLALMLIQELWKRENQSKNQIQLVERAGALHDQVVLFLESFTAVGFELKQASEKFEEAEKRLVSGRGNVLRQTEMLNRLGAKNKKDLREKSGLRKLAEEAELSKEEE